MTHSETLAQLGAALAKAQAAMTGAHKGAENPFFASRYADLAACWDACRGPLSSHGLAVLQPVCTLPSGDIGVTTLLLHDSGEWIAATQPIRPVKDDPQGRGSAITYARRYGLCAMVGIAPEDDDGEAAMSRGSAPVGVTAPATPEPVRARGGKMTSVSELAPALEPLTKGWFRYRVIGVARGDGAKPHHVMIASVDGDWKKDLITWDEARTSAAEQYCAAGVPVRIEWTEKPAKSGTKYPPRYTLTEITHLAPAASSIVAADMATGPLLDDAKPRRGRSALMPPDYDEPPLTDDDNGMPF